MKQVEWKEKKTSLGNAIIISVVMAVIGVVVGANWNSIFGMLAPYFGVKDYSKNISWFLHY